MNLLTISCHPDTTLDFASALAHEVRNPLGNINLSVEMLESSLKEEDKDLKVYLDIIMRSSMRINDLINELFKNQQNGEGHAAGYSVHKLLDEVLEMAKDRIILKDIKVRKCYASEDCIIVLNRPKMKIALANIVINAVDAMNGGKKELKITTKSVNDNFIIEIEDSGCGISKEDMNSIFNPFFTRKPGGLGLGLATTYNTLWADKVGISVESEEGKGTCFILSFDKKHLCNT